MRTLSAAVVLACISACGPEGPTPDELAAETEAARLQAASEACDAQTAALAHIALDKNGVSPELGIFDKKSRMTWDFTTEIRGYKREYCVLESLPQCGVDVSEIIQAAAECVLAVEPWPILRDNPLERAQYIKIDKCYEPVNDVPSCCRLSVDPYYAPNANCFN